MPQKSEQEILNAIYNGSGIAIVESGSVSYNVTSKYGRCSAIGGVDIWTPTAGKSLRITDIVFSSLSANAFYLIGASDVSLSGPIFLGANGGWAATFKTPISLSANEVLGISADNANSIGYYITGYEV